jgi:hypothetical protein
MDANTVVVRLLARHLLWPILPASGVRLKLVGRDSQTSMMLVNGQPIILV